MARTNRRVLAAIALVATLAMAGGGGEGGAGRERERRERERERERREREASEQRLRSKLSNGVYSGICRPPRSLLARYFEGVPILRAISLVSRRELDEYSAGKRAGTKSRF